MIVLHTQSNYINDNAKTYQGICVTNSTSQDEAYICENEGQLHMKVRQTIRHKIQTIY